MKSGERGEEGGDPAVKAVGRETENLKDRRTLSPFLLLRFR